MPNERCSRNGFRLSTAVAAVCGETVESCNVNNNCFEVNIVVKNKEKGVKNGNAAAATCMAMAKCQRRGDFQFFELEQYDAFYIRSK